MNSKLVTVLASVCIACVLIIIGEWFYSVHAQRQALTSAISAETKIAHDEMPGLELTRRSEESFADLVSRPLFIKGRRPVDESSPEEEKTVAEAGSFDWQLNGVYSTKKGLSALFSRPASKVPKDNHRKISTGADLEGWKLTEIQEDRAILKQGSQQKELLLRKPKSKELSRNTTIPNAPNMPNVPNIPQPPIGELENQ